MNSMLVMTTMVIIMIDVRCRFGFYLVDGRREPSRADWSWQQEWAPTITGHYPAASCDFFISASREGAHFERIDMMKTRLSLSL